MDRYEHGGRGFEHPGALDFSANLNPLGMPPCAVQALRAGVESFAHYPDPANGGLRRAIATFEGVDACQVLACAGATDALWRLCQVLRPHTALVCDPCYSGYEQALEQVGTCVRHLRLDERTGFSAGNELARALDGYEALFVANPNNPTGRCLDRETLLACLRRARRTGATVVLDECFVDLCDARGSVDLLEEYPNLVVVKALTKSFCLAGLRVGYVLCADESLMARLEAAGQPWAVSVPAQLAGQVCLGPEAGHAFLDRSRELVRGERERMSNALCKLGLGVVPSEASFLLFCAPRSLYASLLAHGVLVRSCQNYHGLDERWHRVAVRMPNDNDRLLAALGEVLR
ncbi:MAG: histidinol-phosphate transaminase [Coriobacteriales bacterium]|nr:histidinol-phosphate transaminase [Coriobacteriales bacterium]